MGFVKGTDGIARTVRNPLEGSIGDITLNDVSVSTLSASANISTSGNLVAVGNVDSGNVVSTALVRGATVQATGNLVGGNANISNGVFATTGSFGGNVSAANLSTGGRVFATGNVDASGAVFSGNVTAANFYGNISVTGNVTGTSANVQLVAGSYTWTFDNSGNLTIPAAGDILLANAQSTISAAGNVTAGNISVGGAANISNVTVNSYTFVPQLWFKGTLSTDQSLTTSNDTIILYNSNSDPLSWGTTAGVDGHIVPTKAGWYEVVSRAQFSAIAGNVNAQINHQIAVNGVQQAISQVPNGAVVGAGVCVVATAMVNLNGTTDYITTSCYTTVAGQQCVGSNSTLLLVKWIST
jgi:hypothetical protein